MKKSKFSEHQIIHILKEYESGKATKDICREHEILQLLSTRGSRNMEGWMRSILRNLKRYRALKE